jgi:hypothetical protein
VLSILEPALRMKAQTDSNFLTSNSRSKKDFICREFSLTKRREKLHIGEYRGTY